MSENKKKALFGSAVLLVALALINKGLGFVKSMIIASVFGANLQTDAYYVADGLMQNALIPITDAVAVSFLPIYLNIKEKSRQEAKAFTSRTITDIFLLAFVLSGILYLAAPLIMKIMLPSYTVEALNLAVSYFRILIWGMCFYMSNQLLQSLLNAEKQYGYSSFTAMLNNLILTGAVVALGRHFGLWAMAAAVPFSYLAQYLFLQIKSRKYGYLTMKYGFRDSRIKKMCICALPVFFGNAISELNQLVDKSLLSGMEAGSVTAVSYASVLYQFASNLIILPMTTIIYTELAESFAADRKAEGVEKLEKGIHISMFFAIPLTFFVAIAADLVVQITYGRGAFDAQAVAMTAQGLRYYGLCFFAYCINALMARACYSLGDTMLPMKIGIGSVSLNIVLSITLSRYMGLRGVVLATAVANILSSSLALIIFNRTKLKIHLRHFLRPGVTVLGGSVIGMICCMSWIKWCPITNGIFVFITAACIHFGIYALIVILGRDEMAWELLSIMKDMLWKRHGEGEA